MSKGKKRKKKTFREVWRENIEKGIWKFHLLRSKCHRSIKGANRKKKKFLKQSCLIPSQTYISSVTEWLRDDYSTIRGDFTECLQWVESSFTDDQHEPEHGQGVHACSVASSPWWPYGLSPARFLCPWNFLGKSTGVGCHFLCEGSIQPSDQTQFFCLACRFFNTEPPGKPKKVLERTNNSISVSLSNFGEGSRKWGFILDKVL